MGRDLICKTMLGGVVVFYSIDLIFLKHDAHSDFHLWKKYSCTNYEFVFEPPTA
jgi:hypothetical protein